MNNTSILVTGGAGFIGSHLCERLLTGGHRVSIVDDLNDFYSPELKRRNLAEVSAGGPVRFHQADIRDQESVARIVREEEPEIVVHLAARAGVRPSLEQPVLYEQTNVGGTTVLLEEARRHRVRKFVFASSSSIYGAANQVPFREDDLANWPISPYAATKIAGEKLCYTFSHLYGLQVTCLRFFTVYGPRQRPDLAIRKFTDLILQGKPIPMFGDGGSGRDYTYIDDIVEGVLAALEKDYPFEVFNLGNSQPVLLREMIEAIAQALGSEARIQPMPEQPGDVPITCAGISKAREMLGYSPRTSFPDGIAKFVEWFVSSRGRM